jgi:hypothetical protein
MEEALGGAGVMEDLLGFGLGLIQIIPFIYKVSQLIMYPAVANLEILAQEKAGAQLLSSGELLESYRRGNITIQTVIEQLGLLGYQDERSKILLQLVEKLLGVGEVRDLYLRGEIDEQTNDVRLAQLGFNQVDILLLKELYNVLPPVQDLVLMAVREVFNPAIAQQYGLFEDFPPEFLKNAQKIGLNEEWAKNYWAAHWQLPSMMQGYWMLHRRVISEDELRLLMRTQDIMPYWRDKLIEISYNPLTRVDVRRMHDVGVLNRQEVYDAYLDIGYNHQNAERMTEFTLRYNADVGEDGFSVVRELTRSTIQTAYKRNLISRDVAKSRLKELGYADDDSDLLLDMLDYDSQLAVLPDEKKAITDRLNTLTIRAYTNRAISREQAEETLSDSGYNKAEIGALLTIADLEHDLDFKADIVSEVKSLYYEETIDVLDLRVILEANEFATDEIEMIISELDVFKFLKGRKLSRTDLRKAFNGKIISLSEYIKELSGLGYPDRYISIILANEGAS